MNPATNPLEAPPPSEVPLPHAPLIRVIAQVAFPLIASIQREDFVGPFQEAIRREYAYLTREQIAGLVVGPGGITPAQPETTWRFADGKANWQWRVSLAPTFLALETRSYTSRDDFMARLQRVIEALGAHVNPQVVERVGLRYVDRIADTGTDQIKTLVRPEILGLAGTEMSRGVVQSIHESLLVTSQGHLAVRGGLLPPNTTTDPSAIDPLPQPSWILDLDMFDPNGRPFDAQALVGDARRFAERIYTFFRWAVTDEFLRKYGGTV